MSLAKLARGFALATAGASALYAFSTRRRPEKTMLMADAATSRENDPASRTLIAAAITGTTAAADPPPAPKPPSRLERRFRLRADETVADGLRRAARGQLADSSDAMAGASGVGELGQAVHGTRKSIKRVRAALRLSREAIGEDAYRRENAQLRTIAGRLAGARDALVLIETLDALEQRHGDELAPQATQTLRLRLQDDHRRAITELADDGALAVTTRQALEEAHARTALWSLQTDGFAAIKPGLRRAYGRGRKRMRAAREQPSAENLHAARKRVKDLWHVAELLREAHPKRMRRLARDAHALAGVLGDHHDLSVLRDYVEAAPQLFSDMEARDTLLTAIDRRREVLQRRALKLGHRLYRRPAKRFVKGVARGWDKRVGTPPRALSR
jgi:CHAD domain-containing protein